MATGYTAKIENGEIASGKDFIKLCLNNFGIMIHRIDENMSIESQDFSQIYRIDLDRYMENLRNHTNERQALIDKWENHHDEYKDTVIKDIHKRIEVLNIEYGYEQSLYQKYAKIRNEVLAWNCSEEYKNIKDFALNQLDMCLPNLDWYSKEIKKYNEYLLDIDKYVEDEYKGSLEYYDRSIQIDKEDYKNTKKEIEEKQKFYDGIIKEIDNLN